MKDLYGREIDYMRISITDRCNLRCSYCMPRGIAWVPVEEVLSYEEIGEVCREAVEIGIRKFKVTGGEPLVRKDCARFIGKLKKMAGVEQVTLTTNGVYLKENLRELTKAGVDGVNISLDTLDEEKYRAITGFPVLGKVRASIEAAIEAGLKVKVNTLLQAGVNEGEWEDLIEIAREHKVDVRFIEMMPIGQGKECKGISNGEVLGWVQEKYGMVEREEEAHGNGPAVYYKIPGFQGSVGFISALHGKFCGECNKIRMTATGQLKPCLCYGGTLSLKEAVREGKTDRVRELLREAVLAKPQMHCFEERQKITEGRQMAQIGG